MNRYTVTTCSAAKRNWLWELQTMAETLRPSIPRSSVFNNFSYYRSFFTTYAASYPQIVALYHKALQE